MTKYSELIAAYEIDVRFADVSGMEHLDMLRVRSEIAQCAVNLTVEERERVVEADKVLLRQVYQFYQAIQKVADLAAWRRAENIPVTHWWWYLDVLAQLPKLPTNETYSAEALILHQGSFDG